MYLFLSQPKAPEKPFYPVEGKIQGRGSKLFDQYCIKRDNVVSHQLFFYVSYIIKNQLEN